MSSAVELLVDTDDTSDSARRGDDEQWRRWRGSSSSLLLTRSRYDRSIMLSVSAMLERCCSCSLTSELELNGAVVDAVLIWVEEVVKPIVGNILLLLEFKIGCVQNFVAQSLSETALFQIGSA